MQLKLEVSEGHLVFSADCQGCGDAVTELVPVGLVVERFQESLGPVGSAAVSALGGNVELMFPEGLVLFDVDWHEVVAHCRDCSLELEIAAAGGPEEAG